MYDPRGESPFRTTAMYSPMEDHPSVALHDQYDWYGADAAYGGTGPAPGFEGPIAWDAAFVPQPRSPKDEPAPDHVGVGADAPPPRPRRRASSPSRTWLQALGPLFGALTVATFTTVCLLGWMLSYGALRYAASYPFSHGLSALWPAIVYGPWLAGCLSVLRAAPHGHRVAHSWITLILFSCVSMGLSIAAVPRNLPDMMVAGLPALSSVVSLHQLVRQLTNSRNENPSASHRAARKTFR